MVTAHAVGDVDTLDRNAQPGEERKMRLVRPEPSMLPLLVELLNIMMVFLLTYRMQGK